MPANPPGEYGSKSLDEAISVAALKKIADKKPEEFLRELKEQGIGNLEDLVNANIKRATSLLQSGSATMSVEFEACYKFTTARPIWDQNSVEQVVSQYNQSVR